MIEYSLIRLYCYILVDIWLPSSRKTNDAFTATINSYPGTT